MDDTQNYCVGLVQEFIDIFQIKKEDFLANRDNLLIEEISELAKATTDVEVCDAYIDICYILAQNIYFTGSDDRFNLFYTAYKIHGFTPNSYQFKDAFSLVHKNNMSKCFSEIGECSVSLLLHGESATLCENEKHGIFYILSEDGKILKPANHRPPNLSNKGNT